ncbi:hypothetical protein C8J57DRAFT_1244675 [Mycena rebaudengoi]|nr:hypothetical protein C8J57DRAFT_1244675 [Mycena rebaudengoi]
MFAANTVGEIAGSFEIPFLGSIATLVLVILKCVEACVLHQNDVGAVLIRMHLPESGTQLCWQSQYPWFLMPESSQDSSAASFVAVFSAPQQYSKAPKVAAPNRHSYRNDHWTMQ